MDPPGWDYEQCRICGNYHEGDCEPLAKPCHQYPQPKGKPPEECFEGTAKADECIRLIKGQYWDECPYGGGWE